LKLSSDQSGKPIAINEFTIFIRGIGGYGGDRGPQPEDFSPPKSAPNVVHTEKTLENQALYYRLSSGDYNPLHADPSMAAMGNFEKPILHGMCTYGYAARAVLKHFCGNDTTKFKGIQARMTKHVFPGETLQTEMWQVSPTKIIFQVKSLERNAIVLGNACVTIEPSSSPASAPAASGGSVGKPGFKSNEIFDRLIAELPSRGAEQVQKIGGVYHFKITNGPNGDSQSWTVDLKSGNGRIAPEAPASADCTITVGDEDCMLMFSGKMNPQQAFMQGKIKLTGNLAFAMKLDQLAKTERSKL